MEKDSELMQRFKTGEASALSDFVRRYEHDVFNFAMRMSKNRHEAEDLAQETFIRALSSAKNYYPGAKPTTWLYKIASNLAIDRSRKHLFKKEMNETDTMYENDGAETKKDISEDKAPLSDEKLADDERNEMIKKSLYDLPARQRAALVLLLYEDRSYSEISQILGVSVGAVETLIFRARREMKQKLNNIK